MSVSQSSLSGHQRKYLRGLAHHKKPVVLVGQQGASAEVLGAIRTALNDHELIKVRMREPEDKLALSEALSQSTDSVLCGLVGHTLILYRAHPDQPKIQLPRAEPSDTAQQEEAAA